jgi:hypothetical protein
MPSILITGGGGIKKTGTLGIRKKFNWGKKYVMYLRSPLILITEKGR